MEPNTHLTDTSLFRWAVGGPALAGLTLYAIAIAMSWDSIEFCGQVECFAAFFNMFKFQIGVIGVAIPLGALVASQHRSVQTKEQIDSQWKQIEAQEKQNIFANHLAHRTHFNEFFEEFKPFEDENTYSKWEIYESIFPSAPDGTFDVNPAAQKLLKEIEALTDRLDQQVRDDQFSLGLDVKLRLIGINKLSDELIGLSEKVLKDDEFDMPANEIEKHLLSFEKIAAGLHSCMNFHKTYVPYSAVQDIIGKINKSLKELSTTSRCERLSQAILKALFLEEYDTQGTRGGAQLVYSAFETELDKLRKLRANEELDFEALDQETRVVLDEYIPAEQREKAIELLPGLLRMIIN